MRIYCIWSPRRQHAPRGHRSPYVCDEQKSRQVKSWRKFLMFSFDTVQQSERIILMECRTAKKKTTLDSETMSCSHQRLDVTKQTEKELLQHKLQQTELLDLNYNRKTKQRLDTVWRYIAQGYQIPNKANPQGTRRQESQKIAVVDVLLDSGGVLEGIHLHLSLQSQSFISLERIPRTDKHDLWSRHRWPASHSDATR